MARTLDLTALRSFVAVADAGGVTRAAGFLNLTQSAVSMQIKRLEEALRIELLDRTGRGVMPTAAGQQLLGYARRMIALNDEAWTRLTCDSYEGEIALGVPHDIVYPAIPAVLRRFAAEYPRMRVQLRSSYTRSLKDEFARGEADLILGTEDGTDAGGETLAEEPMAWVGAPGGNAWRQRPLRLAFEERCLFRQTATDALDRAGIAWEMATRTGQTRVAEATVSADLAVHAMLDSACPAHLERIDHGGTLPALPLKKITLYVRQADRSAPLEALAEMLREAYRMERARDRAAA